jgi:hypothetical protein
MDSRRNFRELLEGFLLAKRRALAFIGIRHRTEHQNV